MADVAAAARGRRLELGLSQASLADRARVSRKWINEFENGKPTAEFALVIRILEELKLRLDLSSGDRGVAATAPRATGAIDLDELLEEHRGR